MTSREEASIAGLPEPFRLDAWGFAEPQRFLRLFRHVWQVRIPSGARELIGQFCRRSRSQCAVVQYSHNKLALTEGPSGFANAQFSYSKRQGMSLRIP
jgi:hypothetical protein